MTDTEKNRAGGKTQDHEWREASHLILYQISQLQQATEKNTEALHAMQTQIAVMQAKSGFFGALGGALSYFAAWGLTYLKGGGKP